MAPSVAPRGFTLNPCLQIVVIVRVSRPELGGRMSVSDRGVPLLTGVNGTLGGVEH